MILIKDPLYGYVSFNDDFSLIIDSKPFQRLRRIKQVFGSDFVYPSANHTRFEHSLGVGFLANKMINHLRNNSNEDITDEDIRTVTCAGLLHDVGHGPFSHAFEGFLARLGMNHEDFSRRIILEVLVDEIRRLGLDPELVAELAAGTRLKKSLDRPYLKQIIGSTIDADKLDYLRRDSYHAGTAFGFIDVERIILHLRIFDKQLCIDEKAKQVIESMILGRALAFEAIYYHKTSRAAQILIDKAINAAADDLNLHEIKDDVIRYIELDDYVTWALLKNNAKSRDYIKMLETRNLLKVAWETTGIIDAKAKSIVNLLSSPKFRENIESLIADAAGVDPKFIAIDLPTLPNIPYRHWIKGEPMQIPILVKDNTGKRIVSLSKISQFVRSIEGFFYAVRVYTLEKHRDTVKKATLKTFSDFASIRPEEMYV